MVRLTLSLILLVAVSLFAEISIVEQSSGKMVLRLTENSLTADIVDNLVYLNGSGGVTVTDKQQRILPAIPVSLFMEKPEQARISVSVVSQKTIPCSGTIAIDSTMTNQLVGKHTSDIISEPYRNAIVHSWNVTPVLSIDKNRITYFTEAIVTINYIPVKATSKPIGDYYRAVQRIALNPEQFSVAKRNTHRAVRAGLSGEGYINHDEVALTFSISGTPGEKNEADGSIDRLVKITPQMLSNAGMGTNLNISDIAVYSSNVAVNNDTTPSIALLPDAIVPVPVIVRDKNKNLVFDSTDVILFYGQGPNYWYSKGNTPSWEFSFNPYTVSRNFYIRTNSGTQVRMPEADLAATGTAVDSAAKHLQRIKRSVALTSDNTYYGHSDREWKWAKIAPGNTTFTPDAPFPFPRRDESQNAEYRIQNARTDDMGSSKVYITYTSGSSEIYVDSSIGTYGNLHNKWRLVPDNSDNFTVEMQNIPGNTSYYDIGSYDVMYYGNLTMTGLDKLRFYSRNTWGTHSAVTYKIANTPSDFVSVIRVGKDGNSVELVDTITSGGTVTFSDSIGKGYSYVVLSESGALEPTLRRTSVSSPLNEYQITDLHNSSNSSDYVIVTAPELMSQAVRLANHKEVTGRFSRPVIVTTTDIYREFSGGVLDPSAIRNFMVYLHNTWTPVGLSDGPDYLVLMGVGHYDYKGIINSTGNYIPPYIYPGDSYKSAIDDFYSLIIEGSRAGTSKPAFSVGRIAATSTVDADNYINKLITMESETGNFSEWRNRVLLIGDDDRQGDEPDGIKDHTRQSDDVGDTIQKYSPTSHIRKLTLFEFPFNGSLKTAAKQAFIDEINSGISFTNFFGHGSWEVMADEQLFTSGDVETLQNQGKYPILSAFSCSIGFFDMPKRICLAGKMTTSPNRGSIVSIASTRSSYKDSNERLAKAFFRSFYQTGDSLEALSVGGAMVEGKKYENSYKYVILGDPSYRPLAENIQIPLRLEDKSGNEVDTLQAYQTVILKGTIPAGHSLDSALIQIEGPEKLDNSRKDGILDPVSYKLPGDIASNELIMIKDNTISAEFVIPPSVEQNKEGSKLRFYGWAASNPRSGTGLVSDLFFSGYDYTNMDTTDKQGPAIMARLAQDTSEADTALPAALNKRVTIDGFPPLNDTINIPQPVQLNIYFSDQSGINTAGTAPGEGVTISLKEIRPAQNYSSYYRKIDGDFRKGYVTFFIQPDEIPRPGEYQLTVTASDYLNNSSKVDFTLDIKSIDQSVYDIGDFYAYPSPAHIGEYTRFMFNTPHSGVNKISLKIFTLSGQLVRHFEDVRPGVKWDLRDQRGNQLSPNIYLYRLYVERKKRVSPTNSYSDADENEIIKSSIRKMAIYPPR